MSPKTGFAGWYAKVAAFNVEDIFTRKREPGPKRSVFVNQNLPEEYRDHKGRVKSDHVYVTNQVITSKYTIITFLPRNLLEQFRRVANMFFLAIAILQFFNKFSTISPGLVIFPLLIVLTITALKDAYEDVKRHQSDRRVNHTPVRILSGGDWTNPNAMSKKSRTFVRGLLPKVRNMGKSNRSKQDQDPDGEASLGEPDPNIDYDDIVDGGDGQHHVFQHGQDHSRPHWKKTIWEDIRVGDIVKIMNNEPFPADIMICATSEEENVAFVETKNLDGETNLKSRNAVSALTHLRTAADCVNKSNTFRIDCDRPDVNMYKLNAAVRFGKDTVPVDMQMTLLRGTVLRNTSWVIGVVMYTGVDTRIVMNSGGTPSKRSKVERQMNPQVFLNLVLLGLMAVACAIVDSTLEKRDYPAGAPWLYNDNQKNDNPSINGLVTWAFALITFQNIVPISLYISIEFVRTCQAAFIYFDKDIFYDKTGQATLARSWNLSDDLGQIEYIFSDKTGTLTQNSMVFRQCSIGGQVYGDNGDGDTRMSNDVEEVVPIASTEKPNSDLRSSDDSSTAAGSQALHRVPDPLGAKTVKLSDQVLMHFKDEKLKMDINNAVNADPESENAAHARSLNGFFSVLSLCHTVLTAAALVQAAADMGYVFRGRDREILRLQTPFSEELEQYELLNILEFTSARKRMSVVLRKLDGEDGRLFLLSKGADNVIFERLRAGNTELKEVTEKHLDEFASNGLRTLTLAYKVIQEDEYRQWSERYHDATIALDDRDTKIEAVSDELEQDLRLLGATAIEDRLQDGVPETIADLKRAGIKIWVATGDKLETAIGNYRHSTNLIGRDSNIIVLRGGNHHGRPVYQQMIHAVEEFFPESGIIGEDGNVVEEPPASSSNGHGEERPYPLRRVDTGVSSIVGQNNGDRPGGFVLVVDGVALTHALADERHKSLLLRLATLCEGVICCRVSPLQKALVVRLAADVGVGISGEEGLQAVNSSDYAIGQFRFLKKLLLVHGHWSYARNGNMILNFFYKNIVCIGVLWWFQIYDAWSSNYVFEYTYLLFWNSFWTLCPVIAIGLFDRIIDSDILMELPELYSYGRTGRWFGIKWFIIYMLDGIYQSAIIFFLIFFAYMTPASRTDGYQIGTYEFSSTMVFAAVLCTNLFNGLNTNVWTGWVFFSVFIGIILVWIYTAIYSLISPGWIVTPIYGNYRFLFGSAYFWLGLPLTVCLALAPRYLAKAWKFGFAPDDIDIMRWVRKMEPHRNVSHEAQIGGRLATLHRPASVVSRRTSHTGSLVSVNGRPSMDPRSASRTDMSTGVRSVHRGFDFSMEENGVAMRRMQSNLSERRQSSRNLASPQLPKRRRDTLSNVLSIPRGLLGRRPTTPKGQD
ncbi:hypothetical protein BD779DRAFT_1610652 [Infundibulicybe gibba]|nr:hypothetical protein BD779DRAFT_1610652 [Infundibulicybe gibba]